MLCLLIVFTLSVYDYQDSHLNAKHFAINILVVAVTVNYFVFQNFSPQTLMFLAN